jgi:hypothetical protein
MFTGVLRTGDAVGGSSSIPDLVSVIVEKLNEFETSKLLITIDRPTLDPDELVKLKPLVRQTRWEEFAH